MMSDKEYTVKVYDDGTKCWYLNDRRHREDGPAMEWFDGERLWYLNGKLHRMDGPAIVTNGGNKTYYVNGELIFRIDKRGNIISRMK